VFQYTVTAALLGSYVAKRTAFLPSTGGQGAVCDQQSDEELGQHNVYASTGIWVTRKFVVTLSDAIS
jgi:hypothetical protein